MCPETTMRPAATERKSNTTTCNTRSLPEVPPARQVRHYELREGETLSGTVTRLPERGTYLGNYLLVRLDDAPRTVALPATRKLGHTVLEGELSRQGVDLGDHVNITWTWNDTRDGEHHYRHYQLEVSR